MVLSRWQCRLCSTREKAYTLATRQLLDSLIMDSPYTSAPLSRSQMRIRRVEKVRAC